MRIHVPVISVTDILIAGFSSGGVEAAMAVRNAGRQVFMIGPETYPGSDICGPLHFWLDPSQSPATPLARELFSDALSSGKPLQPMSVKLGLEEAMLNAGVRWLYRTYPVCLLRDSKGQIAGMVVANRSGFQAILARVILDTTPYAQAGRMTSAAFHPLVPGLHAAQWTTLSRAERPPSNDLKGQPLPGNHDVNGQPFCGTRFDLQIALPDDSPFSWARAEGEARLATWHPGQVMAAEHLFMLTGDRLVSDGGQEEAMRCAADPVFVLGPRSGLNHEALPDFLKPCRLMAAGAHLGDVAAAMAFEPAALDDVQPDYPAPTISGVDLCRQDPYHRYSNAPGILFDLNRFPVFGNTDVIVAGGGTAGAPAAIAAGRAGAATVLLETLACLGGIGTEGRIAKYWFGNRCGFTTEIDQGVASLATEPDFDIEKGAWNGEWKKHWYLREARKAGVDVWFGSTAVAAGMQGNLVGGILAATPWGIGFLHAGAVIDATGNAEVAAAAGAQTVNISKAHVAVQGTGLPPALPGQHYLNTDYTFVDDTDAVDVSRAFTMARHKFRDVFDLAQIIDSRQRQQVKGEIELDPLDFLAGRTFPDTLLTSRSNFDSHGFTIHPVFMAKAPDEEPLQAHVPFRCLLPKGLDGILVTGLGICAHRDALPVIRMQADVQNQGYAAGYAAALAAGGNGFRTLDIRHIQTHLIEIGILAPEVIHHTDSFPLPPERVLEAVNSELDNYLDLAVVFGRTEISIPLLAEAYRDADGPRKLRIAHLLGLMGDATGIETLMTHIDNHPWDKGWDYKGMGQFGFSLSQMDSMIVALGRTNRPEASQVLLRKAESLPEETCFSHFRALTLAFESLPVPEAAPLFERFLKPVQGAARQTLAAQLENIPESKVDNSERNRELKELLLARGLRACGDPNGTARRVLESYSGDLHGHYARHARSLLESTDQY